ncbi:hypothetical protein AMTR_s00086p00164400 [Amborella trichopoda]|uniref:Ribosomal protein L30 ferredoxin-like fold domain-containing protein n=2 Tax=Amborella trichopoda TaxID=13333 RepID=W1NZ19_AMBTC|nr:hypothetical protein AMTR_s00086p00164400 [Amborella trichopoda]
MADEESKPLAFVPETVLKKRKQSSEWAIRKRAQLESRKQRTKENRALVFKKAENFIQEHRNKELDLIRMKRVTKKLRRSFSVNPDAQLLFVIRISGTNDMHPKTKKILYLLKLSNIFDGVFIKVNDAMMKMLKMVEPYITYGYPNMKSVQELVYKKGFGRVRKEKVPLTDNVIIEKALHKYGIICLEDIVHEITTVGPRFKEVIRFLYPFKLNAPMVALENKKKLFSEGGEAGNREDHINELIRRMN